MGTIEEGIGVRRPPWERVRRKLGRFAPLLVFFLVILLLGFILRLVYAPPQQTANAAKVSLDVKMTVNPRADGQLKLALFEVSVTNHGPAPVLGAVVVASLGDFSKSQTVNLAAGLDDSGRTTSARSSLDFYLCDPKRYAEVLNVSFLRQEALDKCLIYVPGAGSEVNFTVSRNGVVLASTVQRIE